MNRRATWAACVAMTALAGAALADGPAPLPTRASFRHGTTALRHGSRIQCLAFSAAGDRLFVGGGNDPLREWNLTTGLVERTFGEAWTQAIATPFADGRFVSGNALRELRVWKGPPAPDAKFEAIAAIKAIARSPDGSRILAGLQNGEIAQFALGANEKPKFRPGHASEVGAVAFAFDGRTFATGGADRQLREWTLESDGTPKVIRSRTLPGQIHALAPAQGGGWLIAGDDRRVRWWDATGERHAFEPHPDAVSALAWLGDGKRFASLSVDGEVRVWSLDAKRLERKWNAGPGAGDALAAHGSQVAVAGSSNVVRRFDIDTGKELQLGEGHVAGIATAALAPNGKIWASVSSLGAVRLATPGASAAGEAWEALPAPTPREHRLAFSADGRRLAVAAVGAETIALREIGPGAKAEAFALPLADEATALAAAPRGDFWAVGLRSGRVLFVDAVTRKVQREIPGSVPVSALAFDAQAPVLAVAAGGTVRVFDVPTTQEIRRFASKDGTAAPPAIADLAFSPDGKTMVLGCYDGIARLVDWPTGKAGPECEGHSSAIVSVAFAADGRTFASASHDRTVRLWETYLGQTGATYQGHEGPVVKVAFGAGDRTLLSASADATSLIWDLSKHPQNAGEPAELSEGHWQMLASEDTPIGRNAFWRFVTAPQAAAFASARVALVDPARIDKLFADLDSRTFAVREKATQELGRHGRWMEGRLETALSTAVGVESRRRLERMLVNLRGAEVASLKQERLRLHRVLSILELTPTAESVALVERIAQGAPEPELQAEAERSLARLKRRIAAGS